MDNSRKIIISLIIVITVLVILLAGVVIYFTVAQEKDNNKKTIVNVNTDDDNQIEDENNTTNDIIDQANIMAIQTFNSQFTIFEGTENTRSQIQALLSSIKASNTLNSEHIIQLDNTGITEEGQLDISKKYKVELFNDDDGYINLIKITEATATDPINNGDNQNSTSSIEQVIFNSKFTPYVGQITGTKLSELVQAILNNNSTNPDHPIGYTSNNMQEISEFLETDKYMVTLKYDDNGYINSINIDKIESSTNLTNNVPNSTI